MVLNTTGRSIGSRDGAIRSDQITSLQIRSDQQVEQTAPATYQTSVKGNLRKASTSDGESDQDRRPSTAQHACVPSLSMVLETGGDALDCSLSDLQVQLQLWTFVCVACDGRVTGGTRTDPEQPSVVVPEEGMPAALTVALEATDDLVVSVNV